LLWPLLTSRSGSLRRPFRRKARSPRIRTRSVTAQPPDLRRLALTTRASRLLARSPCSASPLYPVLVHRLAASLHASFPRSVTLTQLRFTSLAMVYSWEDFHLQDRAHAGRTKRDGRRATVPSIARVASSLLRFLQVGDHGREKPAGFAAGGTAVVKSHRNRDAFMRLDAAHHRHHVVPDSAGTDDGDL